MSHFYDLPPHDGAAVYVMRTIVGASMVVALVLGYQAIRQRDIPRHRAWMVRGYALGLGAGTQAFTGLSWVLILGTPGRAGQSAVHGRCWAINLVVAEWIIRGWSMHPRRTSARMDPTGHVVTAS